MATSQARLMGHIRGQSLRPVPAGVRALADKLRARYGESLQAVLFYGSCLRKGDDREGLVDLYVLVDRYRSAYRGVATAVLNKLLPPNVFYLEVPLDGRTVRAKYAVLTLADFQRGTSPSWFHSYLWGRFAQPTGFVYVRDERTAGQVVEALAQAVVTFTARVLPRLESSFDTEDLWRTGLRLSYRAELRAERADRIRGLFEAAPEYYETLTREAMAFVPIPVEMVVGAGPRRWHARIPRWMRLRSRFEWRVRSLQGKALSVLRLLKASLTFRGGLDYVLWKIERHSGVSVEVTPNLRRRPLWAVCALSWKLYRRGAFR